MLRFLSALLVLIVANGSAAAATVHIVAFGDSATAGWLVPRKDAYPAQLQALLRKKGYDVTVKNAGINGGTLADALLGFDEAIGPDTEIAIVEFGTNDLRKGAPLKSVRARLAEVVRSLHARKIGVLVVGLGHLKLDGVASSEGALYAQWDLPPGKFRARDGAHYNAEGYAIVVQRMLPQVETLIARATATPR